MSLRALLALAFCLCATAIFAQLQTGTDLAVTATESGQVRGYLIYTYKGIPYAQAKRFERAQQPKAWDGVRSSLTWGPHPRYHPDQQLMQLLQANADR